MRVMGRSRREKRGWGRGRVSWVSSRGTSSCRCRVLLGLMVGIG